MSKTIDIKKVDSNFINNEVKDNILYINPKNSDLVKIYGLYWFNEDKRYHRLSKQLEYLTADVNNQVILKEVPYALDRMQPVQYADSISKEYSGIEIKYQNSSSTDDYIRPKTIKGKGVSYMENQAGWHGKAPKEEEYNRAMEELK